MKKSQVLIIAISLIFITGIFGQITEYKIIPDPDHSLGAFGHSVAVDSNIMIIGAAMSNISGSRSGAAVIYKMVDGSWEEDTLLLDADSQARFGWAVDVQDDYIFIGADQDTENGIWSGAVYVYKFDSVSWKWNLHQKIFPNDIQAGDLFGSSVSLSGDFAIIGAREADNDVGAAYIYENSGTSWIQQARLTPDDYMGHNPNFGISSCIDGNYALIGAYYDDSGGNKSGAAYIFHYDGSEWTQQQKLTSSDIHAGDNFGFSVSISGEYAIVGSIMAIYQTFRTGAAYIFHHTGGSWTEISKLLDSSSTITINFGFSVSLSGDYALVGVSEDDQNGGGAGAAHIYQNINSNWTHISKLVASDGTESEKMGWSVDVDKDIVVVGIPMKIGEGQSVGAVYLYSDYVTAINESEKFTDNTGSTDVNIYPNPTGNLMWLKSSLFEFQPGEVEIFDINGRRLVKQQINAGDKNIILDVSSFENGIYLCKIRTHYDTINRKLIIQK